MLLSPHNVAFRALRSTAIKVAKSGILCRLATFVVIFAISALYFLFATPVRRPERQSQSRIARTVLRSLLSDDFTSTLSSSPHSVTAHVRRRLAFELRFTGFLVRPHREPLNGPVSSLSQHDRSPPQV